MSKTTQRTILIIDDCLEDRETYRRYLTRDKNYDYTILEAELGSEGLELWLNHQLDGVLLDYLLPDINGIEFLEELQRETQSTNLPVVMLTGQGDELIAVKAMKAGASDYIVKGKITAEELRLAINSAVDKFNLRAQLQKSQDRLELALDTAGMGTWEWNFQKNTFVCSQLLAQVLDIPENSCLATYESFLQIIHPEDRDIVDRSIKYAISHKSEYQLEFRHLRRDGSIAWIESRGKIYCDRKNELLRAIATFTDITEAKNQEQEIQKFFLQERLVYQIAQQVRQSLDLKEILETTVNQVRFFLNCDRVVIFQFTVPDWNGMVLTESVGLDWLAILGKEIYDPCFASNWVEKYKQGRVQKVENIHDGKLTSCHVDLLTQFQVQANLVVPILEAENLWGLLIAHQCSKPREWQDLEISLLKQLATQVGIAIQQSLLFDRVKIELNERKQTQQALESSLQREKFLREEAEKANRIKDEFLAVLSHELRSPLNPILGWSNILLKDRKLNEERKKQALQIIEKNAKVQSQLIEDLLDISRILRGKLKLEAEKVSLVNVILSALETVRLSVEAKNIDLKFLVDTSQQLNSNNLTEVIDTDLGLWETGIESNYPKYLVLGDSARLQQIVWNLLSNGVKFTPKGGKLTVKLEAIESQAKITVTDTGKGITQEFLPHVFDYFRQADSATTRRFGGLGLGLAIVRYLVEMHGGTVKADSLGKDKGATFTVSVPLLETDKTKSKDDNLSAYEIESHNLEGLRILVVDDELDSREFISFVLEQDGAEVIQVPSAIEALQIFPNIQPDILVSDIGMPEMDGYMLLSEIRKIQPEAGGNIPAIALTAYAGELDRKQALSVGFHSHIAKPVEPDNFIAVVLKLTNKSV
ncbi:response regulator [Mastigocoleus sp. MO_188.B34]|uniref:response regulator n=1 Tax=Mastigocoleus sp. MO_188.B34 TaxID=3036635 RepID=UPI00263150A8|nr:response regulator [Mastigocoleus sp. MO_188.B34]MDJ0694623.1 response regulator [Mastigocoleus sp. MO_188.B34]